MIIVKLIGGLGNQLFQYAAARKIANELKVPLKLDTSGFEIYKLHKYSLSPFNIIEDIATADDIARVKNIDLSAWNQLTKTYRPYYRQHVVCEQNFNFDPNIKKVTRNTYLDGYWQSEKYFIDIEALLRRELVVKTTMVDQDFEYGKMMQSVNSVSVHIRRGDYVTNEVTFNVHGVCGLDYYYKSVDELFKKIENPHFFVFSDDPEWVKTNFKITFPTTFVSHNGPEKNYEDLRLMSLCKHNIIANSTFSWWGAWLNSNPGKDVIAPRHWFNQLGANTDDLIPKSWIML